MTYLTPRIRLSIYNIDGFAGSDTSASVVSPLSANVSEKYISSPVCHICPFSESVSLTFKVQGVFLPVTSPMNKPINAEMSLYSLPCALNSPSISSTTVSGTLKGLYSASSASEGSVTTSPLSGMSFRTSAHDSTSSPSLISVAPIPLVLVSKESSSTVSSAIPSPSISSTNAESTPRSVAI